MLSYIIFVQISYTETKIVHEWTRLTNKEFKILLILLLAEKPITSSEIAQQSGYYRQTLDPYITKTDALRLGSQK